MNSDFEKKLVEQPLRATPAAWRGAILREARDAAAQQALHTPAATGWRSWFWPAPQAWAALAACWLVLLAVHALDRAPAPKAVVQAEAARLAFAEKRQALLDLDVVVVAQQVKPPAPRLPHGASGWLREGKGASPC
jgi:hypothetical protein